MKKVIGYVSTKDLGILKEQDIKNLDVINIAFGLIERHRVVWNTCGNEEYLPKIREIRWFLTGGKNRRRKSTLCSQCGLSCGDIRSGRY